MCRGTQSYLKLSNQPNFVRTENDDNPSLELTDCMSRLATLIGSSPLPFYCWTSSSLQEHHLEQPCGTLHTYDQFFFGILQKGDALVLVICICLSSPHCISGQLSVMPSPSNLPLITTAKLCKAACIHTCHQNSAYGQECEWLCHIWREMHLQDHVLWCSNDCAWFVWSCSAWKVQVGVRISSFLPCIPYW